MTQHFIYNEQRITYTTAGERNTTAILMIHGWYSHRETWRQTIEALQDRYYCVAIDLLGFGDSDKPANQNYCLEAQAARVVALADELGIDRFIIMGHSMGGQIALYIAGVLAPERIIKVVDLAGVVAAKLTPYEENIIYPLVASTYYFPFLMTVTRLLNKLPAYAKNVQFNTWFHDVNALPYDSWAIDRDMALQPGIEASGYLAGQAIHKLNLTEHLKQVKAPTLIIFGKQDKIVPVEDGHLADQQIPDSSLILIDDCGHFPHYEKTQVYLEAIEQFLKQ